MRNWLEKGSRCFSEGRAGTTFVLFAEKVECFGEFFMGLES